MSKPILEYSLTQVFVPYLLDLIGGSLDNGVPSPEKVAFLAHGESCLIDDCPSPQSTKIFYADGDPKNFLLTNLIPVCEDHYAKAVSLESKASPFVTLRKDFQFEASHFLPWHAGQCHRLHGHSYKLTVWIERRMQAHGVVMDFADVSQAVKSLVVNPLDHQHLNEFFSNPTAETMVSCLWLWLSVRVKGLKRLRLWETATSCAEVSSEQLLRSYSWLFTDAGRSFLNKHLTSLKGGSCG